MHFYYLINMLAIDSPISNIFGILGIFSVRVVDAAFMPPFSFRPYCHRTFGPELCLRTDPPPTPKGV